MLYIMLDIPVNNQLKIETRILEWHVGMPAPDIGDRGNIIYVTEVMADGDELEAISRRFINLPVALNPPAVSWFGDHAKFIVRNL